MEGSEAIQWLLLSASLPGRSAGSARVRLWRALKELGAASLRDGVALLPVAPANRTALAALASDVEAEQGAAWLLELPQQRPDIEQGLRYLFDRSTEYEALMENLSRLADGLEALDETGARRRLRQMSRAHGDIARIDYFPCAAAQRAASALAAFEEEINRRFSPGEPQESAGAVARREPSEHQGRVWATRRRPWVDRLASAWLIHRHIDRAARFLWLDRPTDCPKDAVGFDFDGATFTHIGDRVTFEVLLISFALTDDRGLTRLAALVHYLDVGGLPVAEAAGLEAILGGLRDTLSDDDALLAATVPVLDALHLRFSSVA